MTSRILAAVALMLPLLSGCGTGTSASGPSPNSRSGHPTGRVDLRQVSADGLDAAVAENKGKVVMVDVWFLGCGECKKAMPHVVGLHEKYGPDGLVVMTYDVMADDWESKDKVLKFLTSIHADFDHYIANTRAEADKVTDKYGVTFTPTTLLFDRAGKRIELPEEVTDDELLVAIRTALAAK